MSQKLSKRAKKKRADYNLDYQKKYVKRYVFKLNTRHDRELSVLTGHPANLPQRGYLFRSVEKSHIRNRF